MIFDIGGWATKTALTNLSNTVPDISTLIQKSDYNKKINELEKNIKKLQTFHSSYFIGKMVHKII